VDTIVPGLGEPRSCPECGRWIKYWEGKYLCTDCWLIFEKEQTLEHPHPEGLCTFITKEAEVCLYFVCVRCGKTLMVMKDTVEENRKKMGVLFSLESVEVKRQEKLVRDREIHEEIERLNERDRQATEKAFLEYVESKSVLVPGASARFG